MTAIAEGFKIDKSISEKAVFLTTNYMLSPKAQLLTSGKSYGVTGMLKYIEGERASYTELLKKDYPQISLSNVYIPMNPRMESFIRYILQAGYLPALGKITKEEATGNTVNPIEFSFNDMFNTDGWALVYITSMPFSNSCTFKMSLDYTYDTIKIGTREVTKYRQVPIQVQKQRTVMKTKQVPFWEVIFSK